MCVVAVPAAMAALSTLQTVSLVAGVAGTALSAYSSYQQGKYQQQVANNNALQAEWQAESARERGQLEEQRHRQQVGLLKGEQRASTASKGFALESGSAVDQLADTAEYGELDALIIRNNYEREAVGYTNQAANDRSSGAMAKRAGTLNAAGSILSGASTVADTWYRYKK